MPRAKHRRAPLWLVPVLLLASACKPSGPEIQPRKVASKSGAEAGELAASEFDKPIQAVRAAGVELPLPADWTALVEDEANFALASARERRVAQVPVCTVELRRQGLAGIPDGAEAIAEGQGLYEYRRGALRGRYRALAGPDGAAVIVNCRGPRSSTRWREIADAMAAIAEPGPAPTLPAPFTPEPSSVVELCTGAPAAMGQVCARRHDGSVYCGPSSAAALERVPLVEPAVQISCHRGDACARTAAGAVHCWSAAAPEPEPLAGVSEARDIAGALIVTGAGKLVWRSASGLRELEPLDDPSLALTGVEQVLPGTTSMAGCVVREGSLWCWGDEHGGKPNALTELAGARDLVRLGDRICAAIGETWTCLDAELERYTVTGCGQRPCGCSLLGAARFSCEDAPYDPTEPRPLGRVDGVVAVAEPCVALADGTVVCRGPIAGSRERDNGPVASDAPGIAHALALP